MMELRFLGQTYSASFNQISTKKNNQTAIFRGQKYNLQSPVQITKQQLSLKKYRGVAYGTRSSGLISSL